MTQSLGELDRHREETTATCTELRATALSEIEDLKRVANEELSKHQVDMARMQLEAEQQKKHHTEDMQQREAAQAATLATHESSMQQRECAMQQHVEKLHADNLATIAAQTAQHDARFCWASGAVTAT